MIINDKKVKELFKVVLKYELLANTKTHDGIDYIERSEGAFKALELLGLDTEYICWSYGKNTLEDLEA